MSAWEVTPSGKIRARGAGVPAFIEMLLRDWFDADERDAFLAGLRDLDERARERVGTSFVSADVADQTRILVEVEQQALARMAPGGPSLLNPTARDEPPSEFWQVLKELVVLGYYTSEIGATQELAYLHIAGSFHGCMPAGPGTRAWAE